MIVQRRFSLSLVIGFGLPIAAISGAWAALVFGLYSYAGFRGLRLPFLPVATLGTAVAFYVGFKNNSAQSRVFVRLNYTAEFSVNKQGDNLVVLELKNTTIPLRNNKNHLDTTFFNSPVKMITPSEIEDASPTVRVVIEMKSAVPFETKVEGREIAIYFKR